MDFVQAAVEADDDVVRIDEIYDKDYEDDNGDSNLVIAWNQRNKPIDALFHERHERGKGTKSQETIEADTAINIEWPVAVIPPTCLVEFFHKPGCEVF